MNYSHMLNEMYEVRVMNGLPAYAYVVEYDRKRGEIEEVEFYDRKGYRARWIEARVSKKEVESIMESISADFFEALHEHEEYEKDMNFLRYDFS